MSGNTSNKHKLFVLSKLHIYREDKLAATWVISTHTHTNITQFITLLLDRLQQKKDNKKMYLECIWQKLRLCDECSANPSLHQWQCNLKGFFLSVVLLCIGYGLMWRSGTTNLYMLKLFSEVLHSSMSPVHFHQHGYSENHFSWWVT